MDNSKKECLLDTFVVDKSLLLSLFEVCPERFGKMGKTAEHKLLRNNIRVDPSTLKDFLCYYCGKMSEDRLEYQLHMLKVHEVMSQSYQLWSDHTMDSLGLRWSETKGHDDRETSCSLPASPICRTPKAKHSDDDDEDYVYEEEKPKRRKKDDEKSRKSAAEKERRAAESQRRHAEQAAEKFRRAEEKRAGKMIRDEEKRKFNEEKKALHQQMQKDKRRMSNVEDNVGEIVVKEEVKRKRRKTEGSGSTRWKSLNQDDGDNQDIAALVTKILVESKKKEASSLDVEEEEVTPEIIIGDRKPLDHSERATKYCKICKKGTHYTFASLFEHYQDHHHAKLKSFHYYGYVGKKLIGKKNLLEREYCQRCVQQFPRPRDYFTHMIQYHINESVRCQVDFENADNADVEARMLFRDRIITLGYNFKFNDDGRGTPYNDRPGTSASNNTSFGDSFGDQTLDIGGPSDLLPSTSAVLMQMVHPGMVIKEEIQSDFQVKQEVQGMQETQFRQDIQIKQEVQVKQEPLDEMEF